MLSGVCPCFVRLCNNDSLVHSMTFQRVRRIAQHLSAAHAGDVSRDLADHFDHVLAQLETIMGCSFTAAIRPAAAGVRGPFVELRVAETVYQTLCATLKVTPLPFPKRS